jgi:hypothetical protein
VYTGMDPLLSQEREYPCAEGGTRPLGAPHTCSPRFARDAVDSTMDRQEEMWGACIRYGPGLYSRDAKHPAGGEPPQATLYNGCGM